MTPNQQASSNQPQSVWVFNPLTKKYVDLLPLFAYIKADVNDITTLAEQEMYFIDLMIDLIPEDDSYCNADIKVCMRWSSERRQLWQAIKRSEREEVPA